MTRPRTTPKASPAHTSGAPAPPTSGTKPTTPRGPARAAGGSHRAERAAARQRRSLREEIDALERSRAELCSALSHDLRNPLSVVVWSSQLLARRVPPEDAARRHLDAITRAAEEMNQILHDLSDAARIPDGRLATALAIEQVELAAILEQAAAPSRRWAAGKDLTLTVEALPDPCGLPCDRERIARVLSGILTTAVRRTPRGGTVTIRASHGPSAAGGEEVQVTIDDSGPEIPEADRASLFELPLAPPPGEARRARPVSHAVLLFVARGIIEAHGGHIALTSAPGGGARFVISLPAD